MDTREERIPLAEERVKIGKTERQGDRVRVRTVTEEQPLMLREALAREDVEIERVPVDAPLDGPADIRTEGDVTIIPVVEERLVVERRLFVVEEIRLTRRRSEEMIEAPVTVRKQRAEIERVPAGETDPEGGR